MQERYALRFESGERRGETLPVPAGGLTFGRRPGNSVQVLDASVSGRHAEVELREGQVLLRDLGSTNGTRVGGERVSEQRLAHGDEVLLGNVRLTFIDCELDEGPPLEEPAATQPGSAGASGAGAADAAGDGVETITADKVARMSAKPAAAVAGVVLILAIGGAAWWWLGRRSPRQTGRVAAAVVAVAGNLLEEGYSFEEGRGGWEGDERSPAGFEAHPDARRSGEVGLRAELRADTGAWALARSPAVRVPTGRQLVVRGWIEPGEGTQALLGLRLESTRGAAAPTVAWSEPLAAGVAGEVELAVDVPPVYDGARALLLARLAGGATAGVVSADDVSLVAGPAAGGRPKVAEIELFVCGSAAVLFEIDRALLTGVALVEGAPSDPTGVRAALRAETVENGIRLEAAGNGSARRLALYVEPALAEGGIASTGEGGYRTHQVEFEREGAAALLFGAGHDLVRVALDVPGHIAGRPEAGGFRIEAELGDAAGVLVQLAFRAERDEAATLARQARRAAEEGRPGDALHAWQRLLDEFPFEAELVTEAREVRGRLEQLAHEELRLVRRGLERARFFRLVDLYRRLYGRTRGLAESYAPSAVADEARAQAEEIQGELAVLERDLDRAERGRLAAIEAALREQGSTRLAERVAAQRKQLEAAAGGSD